MKDQREPDGNTEPVPVKSEDEPAAEAVEEALDLEVERIDTQGVLKEGFAGQEM